MDSIGWSTLGVPAQIPAHDFCIPTGNWNVYTLSIWLAAELQNWIVTASTLPFTVTVSYNFRTMKYEFTLALPAAAGIIEGGWNISFPGFDFDLGQYTARDILGGDPSQPDWAIFSPTVYPDQKAFLEILNWEKILFH